MPVDLWMKLHDTQIVSEANSMYETSRTQTSNIVAIQFS